MPLVERIYRTLCASNNTAADEALLAALQDMRSAPQIVDMLLERKTAIGLEGLLHRFNTLDEKIQKKIVEHINLFHTPLRRAVGAYDLGLRQNTLAMVINSGDVRVIYLLAMLLGDEELAIRHDAAKSLLALARKWYQQQVCNDGGLPERLSYRLKGLEGEQSIRERNQVVSAVITALRSFRAHHRLEVMETAMWMLDLDVPEMWELMSSLKDQRHDALFDVIARSDNPWMVGWIFRALNDGGLRSRVVRSLRARRHSRLAMALVAQGYRALDLRNRRGLIGIKDMNWIKQLIAQVLQEKPPERHHLPRVVMSSGLQVGDKLNLLRNLVFEGDQSVSNASVWTLIGLRSIDTTGALQALLSHESEDVQLLTTREMIIRRVDNLRPILLSQMSSPFPSVRALVAPHIAGVTFNRYWQAFPKLDSRTRHSAGHALAKINPDFFVLLERKLFHTDPSDRLQAVQVVGELEMNSRFDTQLNLLTTDEDERVRATVIRAIAEFKAPSGEPTLLVALHDTDSRVVANAIDALESLDPLRFAQCFQAMLNAPAARVRANAIKALAHTNPVAAEQALEAMLSDQIPTHRQSALWVAGKLKLPHLINKLKTIAQNDPVRRIRRKAMELCMSTADWVDESTEVKA